MHSILDKPVVVSLKIISNSSSKSYFDDILTLLLSDNHTLNIVDLII